MESTFLSTKKLLFYFFLVCTVFSAPLFYLLNTHQKDFEEKNSFNLKELDGIHLFKKVIPEFETNVLATEFKISPKLTQSDFDLYSGEDHLDLSSNEKKEIIHIFKHNQASTREELSEKFFNPLVRSIANYSNLILDPDLDTYYLMDVSILRIPHILQYLSRDSDFTSVERLLKNVQSEISEVLYSLNTAIENNSEKNEFKITNNQELLIAANLLKDEINSELSTKKHFDLKEIVARISKLELLSTNALQMLLEYKSSEMQKHNRIVLQLTLGCWLLGALIGFYLFKRILAAQSSAFTEINSQKQKIQETEKLSTLGELASGIIHEIKNPLTIIDYEAGKLQKLLQTTNFDIANVIVKLKKISEMAERINKITKMVTIYSRNSQNDPFKEENVQDVLNEVHYLTKLKASKFNVTIEMSKDEFSFDCRRIQIEQVLINMINNSIDAVETLSEKWVKVLAKIVDKNGVQYVRIELEDSGSGISKQTIEKMFESFYTTKSAGKGTGFGLSVSKNIISAHNGVIYYDSNSINTKFVIEIPKKNT